MIAAGSISAPTVSEAWAHAFTAVMNAPHQRLYHLVVQMQAGYREKQPVRTIADAVLASLEKKDEPTIVTVRNTIFPKSLVRSTTSAHELPVAFEAGRLARNKIHTSNVKGRYFERLIALKRSDGQPFNQLAHTIDKLRQRNARARFEIELVSEVAVSEAIAVYSSERDANKPPLMGFPCLSHVAFQRDDDVVHCVAYYRSQDMAQRAYGNYWALGQLQQYVAEQAGLQPGTLTVVSGVATLGIGVTKARAFATKMREVLAS